MTGTGGPYLNSSDSERQRFAILNQIKWFLLNSLWNSASPSSESLALIGLFCWIWKSAAALQIFVASVIRCRPAFAQWASSSPERHADGGPASQDRDMGAGNMAIKRYLPYMSSRSERQRLKVLHTGYSDRKVWIQQWSFQFMFNKMCLLDTLSKSGVPNSKPWPLPQQCCQGSRRVMKMQGQTWRRYARLVRPCSSSKLKLMKEIFRQLFAKW